jgi:hypothetical protein
VNQVTGRMAIDGMKVVFSMLAASPSKASANPLCMRLRVT